jgi:hypothetical protein
MEYHMLYEKLRTKEKIWSQVEEKNSNFDECLGQILGKQVDTEFVT